jgi:hypothetical protein
MAGVVGCTSGRDVFSSNSLFGTFFGMSPLSASIIYPYVESNAAVSYQLNIGRTSVRRMLATYFQRNS